MMRVVPIGLYEIYLRLYAVVLSLDKNHQYLKLCFNPVLLLSEDRWYREAQTKYNMYMDEAILLMIVWLLHREYPGLVSLYIYKERMKR